ncbi:MAG: DUF2961 domain-containing protein [Candidatus Hydrogenedens sp.]|nr:DUF2961 domain-containing protein [Candidatus Hydrogenedens sp.]
MILRKEFTRSFSVAAFLFFLLPVLTVSAASVNFGTMLEEMTDMERLITLDTIPYTTGQFSSYDRLSTDPTVLTDQNWFANLDRNNHLRVEERDGRQEWVLMDVAGPGAVVRFWSANPLEGGIVRFYLDHSDEPVIEMPLAAFLEGRSKPFISPLCGNRGQGWNSYVPIPYAEHCKITIDEGDIYYIINYRTYTTGTEVDSFTFADTETHVKALRDTAATLLHPDAIEDKQPVTAHSFDVTVSGADSEDFSFSGPAAIRGIRCSVEADNLEEALRGCLLKINFDENEASVLAPLGDFFGTAPGVNEYQSLPSGTLDDGRLYSRWVMPFQKSADIELINFNRFAVRLSGEILVAERPWTEDSLYFHAKWKGESDIATRPMQDWNYMTAQGQGRFCGVMLHITNPVTHWWGEGDEKIYVDGDTFPTWFGTGTEDYYGYAWCSPLLFTHAYHNQSRCDGPGNLGHTCVSRFHIMDDIPFTRDFRFDMEVWHWADTHIAQSITAFWYATAESKDNFSEPGGELLPVPTYEVPEPVEGALEGENMRVMEVSAGTVDKQSGSWPWSSFLQLWWRGGAQKDHLKLRFRVEKAGNYAVSAVFTKAPDYGIHEMAINGTVVAPALDLYNADEVIVSDPVSLGRVDFVKGFNFIDVRIVDKHPDSKDYMFGLDYILLEP